MRWFEKRQMLASCLCLSLLGGPLAAAQEGKFKLTIVDGATTGKRAKKGKVSSEAVIRVTDENDVPVAGIAVAFLLPQAMGGASFAGGGLSAIVTTNAAGLASSGSFSATAGSSFGLTVSASVPGGTLTATIPVNTAAMAAASSGSAGATGGGGAGGGLSTGVLVGVIAAVGAAVGGGLAATRNKEKASTAPAGPRGTVGAGAGPVFGGPQ